MLPAPYTEDARVIELAEQSLPLAAPFQLTDGTQVVTGGVLRGMGCPDAAAVVHDTHSARVAHAGEDATGGGLRSLKPA
jgi:Na+-driven multidrug efflux pump